MDEKEQELKTLENSLNALRLAFDLYFQGIERIPPEDRCKIFHKEILRFQATSANAPTAIRYRINSLVQRFTSYNQMWRRELTAMENGTSKRDRFRKAQQKTSLPAPIGTPAHVPMPDSNTLDAKRLKQLYGAYVSAQQKAGRQTQLTLAKLSAQLNKQMPKLKAKHPGKNIDFKVVLKNGTPQFKAVVK